jgi:hypothetical protein
MAKQLVDCSKYRPIGKRALAMTPQMQYEIPNLEYTMKLANETTLTVPMIETLEGLAAVEEIVAVDGVDMLFVGAFDMSDEYVFCRAMLTVEWASLDNTTIRVSGRHWRGSAKQRKQRASTWASAVLSLDWTCWPSCAKRIPA